MVLLYLVALPLFSAAVTRETSAKLTELLWDARDEAVQLASDADQMQMLILSDNNWLTHDLMLHKIQGHVDDMALIVSAVRSQGLGRAITNGRPASNAPIK